MLRVKLKRDFTQTTLKQKTVTVLKDYATHSNFICTALFIPAVAQSALCNQKKGEGCCYSSTRTPLTSKLALMFPSTLITTCHPDDLFERSYSP